MTDIWEGVKSERQSAALATLAASARDDLARLNFPAASWVPERQGSNGRPLLDVLVIGAGLCGQTLGFALMRDGIRNVRIVDRAPKGREGPWATYARMHILRSPKHLTGPDLGVPSLTFRAWYEAQHGPEGWQRLHKAGRLDWQDYLGFVRETVGVAVENEVEALSIKPSGAEIAVDLNHGGRRETVLARKVVLAGGREGAGAPRQPAFPGSDAPPSVSDTVFHSASTIAFDRFAGRRVAVVGGAATAFDCAATALEAGAAEVVLLVRRPHLPQVNKSKWMSFPGFFKGYAGLDDDMRWRMFTYAAEEQVPPPFESVLRCERFANFRIAMATPVVDVVPGSDSVTVVTPRERLSFDALIFATGFDVDLSLRPELTAVHKHVLLWRHRIEASRVTRHPECGRFPYLGEGFELMERTPGSSPGLSNVHLFNWGATLSHGALAGDIPGLATGVNRLADALARDLFLADRDLYWSALQAHEEAELAPTRLFVPREARQSRTADSSAG